MPEPDPVFSEPDPVHDLGGGDPPEAMKEKFGMESVPEDGDEDEVEGEIVPAWQATAESEQLADQPIEPHDHAEHHE